MAPHNKPAKQETAAVRPLMAINKGANAIQERLKRLVFGKLEKSRAPLRAADIIKAEEAHIRAE